MDRINIIGTKVLSVDVCTAGSLLAQHVKRKLRVHLNYSIADSLERHVGKNGSVL